MTVIKLLLLLKVLRGISGFIWPLISSRIVRISALMVLMSLMVIFMVASVLVVEVNRVCSICKCLNIADSCKTN